MSKVEKLYQLHQKLAPVVASLKATYAQNFSRMPSGIQERIGKNIETYEAHLSEGRKKLLEAGYDENSLGGFWIPAMVLAAVIIGGGYYVLIKYYETDLIKATQDYELVIIYGPEPMSELERSRRRYELDVTKGAAVTAGAGFGTLLLILGGAYLLFKS